MSRKNNIYKQGFPPAFEQYMEKLITYMEKNEYDILFEQWFFRTSKAKKYKEWLKGNKRSTEYL